MAATERPVGPKNVSDHVSLRARLTFCTGVFCVFAPFCLVYDLASPKGLSWQSLALWTVYSGATSVGWAYAFTRNLRFLWIWIPVSFLVPQYHGARPHLIAEAVICLSVIVMGNPSE